jgi:hypothetical protein
MTEFQPLTRRERVAYRLAGIAAGAPLVALWLW